MLMKRFLLFYFVGCCLFILATAGGLAGAESRQGVRFHQLGAPSGLLQYVSEAWGVVGVDVINGEDQAVDILAACAFSPDPDLQFVRRVSVPARSIRRTWVPVKLPEIPLDRQSVACYGLLIDDRSGAEVVLRREYEGVQHQSLLRVNHDRPLTGFFSDDSAPWDPNAVDYAYEAAIALRTSRGLQRRVVSISGRDLPPLREVFDGLRQIVLCDDAFASDVAVLSPLRSWLHEGGELWVMLDRVDFGNVERLLGEAFTCWLVDRVQLHEVAIAEAIVGVSAGPVESYEQPLDFVRVLVDGMQVTHTVDGWPAAFMRQVGRGRVIFTTLDARAWIQRPRMHRPQWDATRMSDYWPNEHLESLWMLQVQDPPLCSPEVFRGYLFEKIGYRIASRGAVSAVLGLFCGGLLLAGVGLAWRRRLEHLAWIAPGLALAAAVPLAGLGLQAERAIPATVGQAQFIEASDGADQINASGLLAFYDPALMDEARGVTRGGVFEPEDGTAGGGTRRMVWTDVDRWHWENLRPTTGLWTASFRWSEDLSERLRLQGSFSSEGFVAHWTDSPRQLTDAVLAIPGQPYLAVHSDGARLVAGPGSVLPRGRYVASGWLSDEQRRRQEALENMLVSETGRVKQVARLTLLGWSDPIDMGFRFPQSAQRVGAALWAVPVSVSRASPGTSIVIPSPFVSYRASTQRDGEAASPVYDHRLGEWLVAKSPSNQWLRFQVPEAVLPLRMERARLMLHMTAPGRTVEILRGEDDHPQPLHRVSNPIGLMEITLSGAALPDLDPAGRFVLGVAVGPTQDKSGSSSEQPWRIERVQMEVAGVVEDQSSGDLR
jgi:hypothetical protein